MLNFIVRTIDALDLPEKFLLAGHSYGGYLVSLYASQRPERVESLFLVSPAFIEPYIEESYDPTQFSDMQNPRQRFTLAKAQESDLLQENRVHFLQRVWNLPRCMQGLALGKVAKMFT